MQTPPSTGAAAGPQLRDLADDALRYWEPRRIAYNLSDEIYPAVGSGLASAA